MRFVGGIGKLPLATLLFATCVVQLKPISGIQPSLHDQYLATPLTEFTCNLFRATVKDDTNIVMSPLSIHRLISTLLLGAGTKDTLTRDELVQVLGYHNMSQSEVHKTHLELMLELQKYNGIRSELDEWRAFEYRSGLNTVDKLAQNAREISVWTMAIATNSFQPKRKYLKELENYYNTSLVQIDGEDSQHGLSVLKGINKWAKGAGFKSKIIKKEDIFGGNLTMMLLSSIKFKARWFDKFQEVDCMSLADVADPVGLIDDATKCLYGESMDVTRFYKFNEEDFGIQCGVLTVPLADKLSLTIFEPQTDDTVEELAKLEARLFRSKEELVATLRNVDDQRPIRRTVVFPRFRFETLLDLVEPLKSMGLQQVFTKDESELFRIVDTGLHVSHLKHLAMVETNKFAIRASSITRIGVFRKSVEKPNQSVIVKNPFVFIIRYDKLILFIGHVVKV